MKQHLLITLLAIFTLTSCTKKAVQTETTPKVELPQDFEMIVQANNFLDEWHKAAAQADFDAFFSRIANNAIYIGTDKTEVWSKQEFQDYSKPYFDRGIAWDFKSEDRNLYIGNNKEYFWFDEVLSTWMGASRGSGVVHYDKSTKEFQVVHYVLSLPIPNDAMNDVLKVIKQYEQPK